jgi:solute carrier family 34 (sodium-dependent phosphate cotransporter)
VTGLLASMVSGKVEALQVALAHLFFNISGILIFYPIPWMRQWPLRCARALGKGEKRRGSVAARSWFGRFNPSLTLTPTFMLVAATRENKFFPVLYIVFTFFICPLTLLGISILWDLGLNQPSPGLLTLAIIITIACLLLGLYFWYGCTRGTMKRRYNDWGVVRSRRKLAVENLADDMEKIKGELVRLKAGINDKAEDKNLEVSIVDNR